MASRLSDRRLAQRQKDPLRDPGENRGLTKYIDMRYDLLLMMVESRERVNGLLDLTV